MKSSDKSNNLNINKLGIILAAYALTSVSMGKMIIISGFSEFSAEFPQISLEAKQLLISIASLSGIPVSLLMGRVVLFVSKRKLAILSALLFTVGGLWPIFTGSFGLMFAARCILGFGMAMCSTLATAVIVEFFTGDERSKLIGYNSAVKSLFGIAFSYLGGILAMISWRSAYWLHLIGVAVLILVLVFLPEEKPEKEVSLETGQKQTLQITLPVWYYSFAAVVMFIFFSAHGNNIALLFSENQIGSPSQAGTASAIFSFGGFLAGLLFHRVFKIAKDYTQILGYVLAAVSIFYIGFAPSFVPICVASFIFGLGFYLIIPHQTLLVTGAVSKEAYTLAAAIYLSAINLGQVVSPVVLNRLSVITFNNGVNGRYLVAGIGLIVMAIVGLVRIFIKKKAC